MHITRIITRSSLRNWRSFSLCSAHNQSAEAQPQAQTEPVTIPPPANVDKPLSPKIEKLIADISSLSLIEVSELTGGLKRRLNLPDAPVGFAAAPAAPAEDEDDSAPKAVKSSFTVKLMKFDEKQKVALIKEVKNWVEGMNLVQAKKFVEGAPAVVKADISKEEADKLKEALTKVGAEVVVD